MKFKFNAVAVTILLSAASLAQADYQPVPADNSPLTQLCVAALSSQTELRAAQSAADIHSYELDSVRCNAIKLAAFVDKYGEREAAPVQPEPQTFAFDRSDNKPETRLCLAAVTSGSEFRKLKSELFADDSNLEEEVLCNGISLKRFAQKYAGSGLNLSQR